jgi:hypothetical protein
MVARAREGIPGLTTRGAGGGLGDVALLLEDREHVLSLVERQAH